MRAGDGMRKNSKSAFSVYHHHHQFSKFAGSPQLIHTTFRHPCQLVQLRRGETEFVPLAQSRGWWLHALPLSHPPIAGDKPHIRETSRERVCVVGRYTINKPPRMVCCAASHPASHIPSWSPSCCFCGIIYIHHPFGITDRVGEADDCVVTSTNDGCLFWVPSVPSGNYYYSIRALQQINQIYYSEGEFASLSPIDQLPAC